MIEMHEPSGADWNAKRKEAREIAASHGHRLGRFNPIFYPGGDTSAFAATQAYCETCGHSFAVRAYWRLWLGKFSPYFRMIGWASAEKCARSRQANRVPEAMAA